jgi:hypothetical protein
MPLCINPQKENSVQPNQLHYQLDTPVLKKMNSIKFSLTLIRQLVSYGLPFGGQLIGIGSNSVKTQSNCHR